MKTMRWFVAVMAFAVASMAFAQAGTVDTSGVGTAGVVISSSTSYPDVDVKTGNTSTSALRIFNSNSTELMRINAAGSIGIGTATPARKVHIFENSDAQIIAEVENPNTGTLASAAYMLQSNTAYLTMAAHGSGRTALQRYGITLGGWTEVLNWSGNGLILGTIVTNAPIVIGTNNVERMRIAGDGKVAIGTTAPLDLLHLNATSNTNVRLTHSDATSAVNMIGFYEGTNLYGFVNQRGSTNTTQPGQFNVGNNANAGTGLWAGGSERVTITAAGNVGIGTPTPSVKLQIVGDAIVTGTLSGGNIQATYQDVAEWVPSAEDLDAGTVVVLNRERDNEVMRSTLAYDTAVAGVVSARPGVILGEAGAAKEAIATTGRVRVHVDATRNPIAIGDLLVTGDKPGTAMKSIPVEIAGIRIHRPGTVIGKALQALPSGEGDILVLLSLQ